MDRPIIFSGAMVRALLEGRKTMTRRVFKVPTKGEYTYRGGWEPTTIGGGGAFTVSRDGSRKPAPEAVCIWNQTTGTCVAAPYQVGDRLYVRESFVAEYFNDGSPAYMADYGPNVADVVPKPFFRPSIHMPRKFSRITLTVEAVKVERLQDIVEPDAIAEGVQQWVAEKHDPQTGPSTLMVDFHYGTHAKAFEALWDSLNAKRAPWDSNPWVVAPTFKVHKCNIDKMEKVP